MLFKYLKLFGRLIVGLLCIILAVVILLSTVHLGWSLIALVTVAPGHMPDLNQTLDIFGMILLVLIGIELLESIGSYLTAGKIHIEIVLRLALIAIARKIIVMESQDYQGLTLIGIGVIILALALAHYLTTRSRNQNNEA